VSGSWRFWKRPSGAFLYGLLDPFLDRHHCAIILIHHTPKFRDDQKERSYYAQLYAGSGDATLANWPRASFFVWPADEEKGLFKLVSGKRGRRVGWGTDTRYFKWSDEFILWTEASKDEVASFNASKETRGRVQSISAQDLYSVMKATKTDWILRADLIQALREAGFSKAAAERTVHPDDGYQRKNLLYEGKGRRLQIKWNGFDQDFQ
jgi:hypothetical protein